MDEPNFQVPRPGIIPEPPRARPFKDKNKLLVIILCASAGFLLLFVLLALLWPRPTKAPVTQTTESTPTGKYFYVGSFGPDPNVEAATRYTVGMINPATAETTKTTIGLPAGMHPTGLRQLQFSADGKTYLYSATDRTDADDPAAPTPKNFQLAIGKLPQNVQHVIYTDNRPAGDREWLLTADGTEVVLIDTITAPDKTVVSQTLYSISVANGKATKIGDISRPPDRDNTRLFEDTKDKTVSYFTAMDDGIYRTTYDRQKHTVEQKKVVITSYDLGFMGQPSPDGKKLLYIGGTLGGPGNITVYVLDLTTGGATPLLDTPAKYGGYADGVWSPDSKLVVLTSALKDVNGAHTKNQLLTVDTTVKATQTELLGETISPTADNSASSYHVSGWSPDGRYISFVQNSQVLFFDLKTHKVLPDAKVLNALDPGVGSIGSGWITPSN